MAKKKQTEKDVQQPAVSFRDGKWVTADGLCFNTADKAWRHAAEIAPPEENNIETLNTETIWDI